MFLGLGSNVGRRSQHLEKAIIFLTEFGKVRQRSSIYSSAPQGYVSGHDFLNMVVRFETELDAEELLKKCQQIEKANLRRTTSEGQEDRTLDIDILFFNDQIISKKDIEVPHSGIEKRKFVLVPMMEIEPEFIHPKSHLSIAEIYLNCECQNDVRLYHP